MAILKYVPRFTAVLGVGAHSVDASVRERADARGSPARSILPGIEFSRI